jgi:hypothetical protein
VALAKPLASVTAEGAGENDFGLNIAPHLPDVAGVRFGDIDNQECDLASVLFVDSFASS